MALKEWIKLISWIVVLEAVGFFLGMLTQSNVYSWYAELNKSAFTPPGSVFSIVWPILYVLIAVVGWALWKDRNNIKIKPLIYLYFTQLVMNWAWTPLFFQLHLIGFSFLWILVLVLLNGIFILSARKEKPGIVLALIPYFLWLLFAAYLNGVIWLLN
jgi:tryptophan-rich sensory protein